MLTPPPVVPSPVPVLGGFTTGAVPPVAVFVEAGFVVAAGMVVDDGAGVSVAVAVAVLVLVGVPVTVGHVKFSGTVVFTGVFVAVFGGVTSGDGVGVLVGVFVWTTVFVAVFVAQGVDVAALWANVDGVEAAVPNDAATTAIPATSAAAPISVSFFDTMCSLLLSWCRAFLQPPVYDDSSR